MKLLDQVRAKLRLLHYSYRTETNYVQWIERYLRFHKQGDQWRHPRDMGKRELEAFLTDLATVRHVSASTQNQALGALLFLYQKVLEIEIPHINPLRAIRSARLPVVLSIPEVRQILDSLSKLQTQEPSLKRYRATLSGTVSQPTFSKLVPIFARFKNYSDTPTLAQP